MPRQNIKELLKRLLKKEDFKPGLLGIMVNPFYFARKGLYKNIKLLAGHITGRVLDVGCGRKPYQHLFNCSEYIGMDIENPGHSHKDEHIDIYYDGKTFPLQDKEFDNVICSQVLEHVFTPDDFLKEIHRVVKKGGCLLLTVPFVWDEHEQPYDYARYSSFGIKFLLEKNGFTVVKHVKSLNNLSLIFQLTNAYIFKKLMTKNKVLRYLSMLVFIFPINLLGILINAITPNNDDLYLDNIILAQKN